MCSKEIKTNKPVVIFTDTLFTPNGRWVEHLNRDTLCSIACFRDLITDENGAWLDTTTSRETEDGARCCSCEHLTGDLDNEKSAVNMSLGAKPRKKSKGKSK